MTPRRIAAIFATTACLGCTEIGRAPGTQAAALEVTAGADQVGETVVVRSSTYPTQSLTVLRGGELDPSRQVHCEGDVTADFVYAAESNLFAQFAGDLGAAGGVRQAIPILLDRPLPAGTTIGDFGPLGRCATDYVFTAVVKATGRLDGAARPGEIVALYGPLPAGESFTVIDGADLADPLVLGCPGLPEHDFPYFVDRSNVFAGGGGPQGGIVGALGLYASKRLAPGTRLGELGGPLVCNGQYVYTAHVLH